MSHNITGCTIRVHSLLGMKATDLIQLQNEIVDRGARTLARDAITNGRADSLVPLENLAMLILRARSIRYEWLKSWFLARIRGHAELFLTWEDGTRTGLIIRDGKVTECDVVETLVPRKVQAGRRR